MNRFPGDRSVLLLDNCRIHKSDQLQKAFEEKGLFFPMCMDVQVSQNDRLYSKIHPAILAGPQSN